MRMRYQLPPLDAMIASANQFDMSHRSRVGLAAAVAGYYKDTNTEESPESRGALGGAYVFAMDGIASGYYLHHPSYQRGYLYNSGSREYSALEKALGITNKVAPDGYDKMEALNHLYIALTKGSPCEAYLLSKKIDVNIHRADLLKMLQGLLSTVKVQTNALLTAIPSETAIDKSMYTMIDDYEQKKKKDNQKRIDLARVMRAVVCYYTDLAKGALVPSEDALVCHDDQSLNMPGYLKREQRVKLGFLFAGAQYIDDEYYWFKWLRSAKGHSKLYDELTKALNQQEPEHVDTKVRQFCLTALKHELQDIALIRYVSKFFENNNWLLDVDSWVVQFRKHVKMMLGGMPQGFTCNVSTTTKIIAAASALIFASPFYGAGFVTGHITSEVYGKVQFQRNIAGIARDTMTYIFGSNGHYLAYYVSTMTINATLERLFAKVFEALGMCLGASAGGGLSLIVIDMSPAVLKEIVRIIIALLKEYAPLYVKDFDHRIIELLMALPAEVFPAEKKEHLQTITDNSVFNPSTLYLFKRSTSVPIIKNVVESKESTLPPGNTY